ncbi:UNVERIFIED_CONTAM: hypothetical protein FOS11_36900 [Bacillus thuringiensis]
MTYIFITYTTKLSPEKSRAIINELRKRMGNNKIFIFTPRPPAGRKFTIKIQDELIIITRPHQSPSSGSSFTLGDILDKKILDKKT